MKNIVSKGPKRSGCTLMRMILTELFNSSSSYKYKTHEGNNIADVRTHLYEKLPKRTFLIVTLRNPFDSLISCIRACSNKGRIADRFPSQEIIRLECKVWALDQVREYHKMISMINIVDNSLEVKYENFHNCFEYLFTQLERFLGVEIPVVTKKAVYDKCSKSNVRILQSRLATFNDADPITFIHGYHIYKGDNNWKRVLTDEVLEIVTPIIAPYIRRWEAL